MPAVSVSDGSASVSSTTTGATILFTTDGSDPRYSKSAQTYIAAVPLESGQTLRAYAKKDGMLPSGVGEGTAE